MNKHTTSIASNQHLPSPRTVVMHASQCHYVSRPGRWADLRFLSEGAARFGVFIPPIMYEWLAVKRKASREHIDILLPK